MKANPGSGIDLISLPNNPKKQELTVTNVSEERTSEDTQSAIKISGDAVSGHPDGLVRSTVEDTLNKLLNAEKDQPCNAIRYEGSDDRIDTRMEPYSRNLEANVGKVSLQLPLLLDFRLRCRS